MVASLWQAAGQSAVYRLARRLFNIGEEIMKQIRKRRIAAFLLMLILAGQEFSVDAAPTREEERQRCHSIQTDTNSLENWPQGPTVYAESAIVMDMDTGAILFGKQVDQKHYPASITKLLTVLVALENSKLTDQVEFSQDSVSFLEYGDAHIGMRPGEKISMEDALYGILYASANEVSYAVGESVGKLLGGDYNTFIQKMNDKMAELGCTGSHWTNTNGLHDEGHYTTAHDMALIASAVYQKEEFRKIMSDVSHTIPPTNLVNESRTFQQRHKMLWDSEPQYYEYCKGGKTGYTDQARTTLVTMADNGTSRLAAVVLYDFGEDAYADTRAMFDYVFGNFSPVSIHSQPVPENVQSFVDEDNHVLLPSGVTLQDLDTSFQICDVEQCRGTISYTYKGLDLGKAEVVFTSDYVKESIGKKNQESKPTPEKKTHSRGISWKTTIVAILFVVLFALVLYYTLVQVRRKRRRKYKDRRRM